MGNTYVTIAEAARELNLSHATITRYIKSGSLPATKRFGRSWKIAPDVFADFCQRVNPSGCYDGLTCTEVAHRLECSVATVQRYIKAGSLKAAKKSNSVGYRVREEDLEVFAALPR